MLSRLLSLSLSSSSASSSSTKRLYHHRPIKEEEEMSNYYCFENFDPFIIKRDFYYALKHQQKFTKVTTPREIESSLWTDKELEEFMIIVDKIDRLYYKHSRVIEKRKKQEKRIITSHSIECKLVCRMKYDDDSYVFIEMNVRCYPKGCDTCEGDGTILVSKDAYYFLENISVIKDENLKDLIRQSMAKDVDTFIDSISSLKNANHRDFKSTYSKICNVNDIDKYVGYLLANQHRLDIKDVFVGNDSSILCDDKVRKNFRIDVEKIDRLYYVKYYETEENIKIFTLICRMDFVYNDFPRAQIFVHMLGIYDPKVGLHGNTFLSTDGDFFLLALSENDLYKEYPIPSMRQSLTEEMMEIYHDDRQYPRGRNFKTHDNFMSVYFPRFYRDAEIIDKLFGRVLHHQDAFYKHSNPYGKIPRAENFQIDIENINRLYLLYCYKNIESGSETFRLLCRMECNNEKLLLLSSSSQPSSSSSSSTTTTTTTNVFVELTAGYLGNSDKWYGTINIYSDINYFLNYISKNHYYKYNIDLIRQSLN